MRSPLRLVALAAVLTVCALTLTGCDRNMIAVDAAKSQIGVPYTYGGSSPETGFDCSGLTQWSWQQADVSLPRSAAEQWAATTPISREELQPGDLVFYTSTGTVSHVAMYIGDGQIVQARKPGTMVEVDDLDTYWVSALFSFGRVPLP